MTIKKYGMSWILKQNFLSFSFQFITIAILFYSYILMFSNRKRNKSNAVAHAHCTQQSFFFFDPLSALSYLHQYIDLDMHMHMLRAPFFCFALSLLAMHISFYCHTVRFVYMLNTRHFASPTVKQDTVKE